MPEKSKPNPLADFLELKKNEITRNHHQAMVDIERATKLAARARVEAEQAVGATRLISEINKFLDEEARGQGK